MITDRTAADVSKALEIRRDYVQKGLPLTAEQVQTLERGTITINTLNRIEEKQAEISELIRSWGYYGGTRIINKAWTAYDIFSADDLNRLVDNTKKLKNAYFQYLTTPNVPGAAYRYDGINDLEKILVDLQQMAASMGEYFRECNTFFCGEA